MRRRLQLGRGRRDRLYHALDTDLELVGQLVHLGALLGVGARFYLPLLRAQPVGLDHVLLEHLDRARHLADFVCPAGLCDLDLHPAFRHRRHLVSQTIERRHDAAVDEEGDQARQGRQHRDTGPHFEEHAEQLRLDVVEIDSGVDEEIPRLESDRVAQLRRGDRLPGLREEIFDHPAAAFRHVDEITNIKVTRRILRLQAIDALHFSRPGAVGDIDPVHRVGDEIFLTMVEPHGMDEIPEARDGLVAAQLTRFDFRLQIDGDAPRHLDDGLNRHDPVLADALVEEIRSQQSGNGQ